MNVNVVDSKVFESNNFEKLFNNLNILPINNTTNDKSTNNANSNIINTNSNFSKQIKKIEMTIDNHLNRISNDNNINNNDTNTINNNKTINQYPLLYQKNLSLKNNSLKKSSLQNDHIKLMNDYFNSNTNNNTKKTVNTVKTLKQEIEYYMVNCFTNMKNIKERTNKIYTSINKSFSNFIIFVKNKSNQIGKIEKGYSDYIKTLKHNYDENFKNLEQNKMECLKNLKNSFDNNFIKYDDEKNKQIKFINISYEEKIKAIESELKEVN